MKGKTLWPLVFFCLFFVLGLKIYDNYGISVDEIHSRRNAIVTAIYLNELTNYRIVSVEKLAAFREKTTINKGQRSEFIQLNSYVDRDYGVAWDLIPLGLEFLLGIDDYPGLSLLRHLLNFLVFWLGVFFFYLTVKHQYSDWRIGLLGACVLILSPRIFADAFYNSKDLVLLSIYSIVTYTAVRFLHKKNLKWAVLHAFACAYLVDIRIPGVIAVAVTLMFLLFDLLNSKNIKNDIKQTVSLSLTYLLITVLLIILMWPYLWQDPVGNFLSVFSNMSKFRWGGSVLYLGQSIKATALPWHYIPVWIAITTPPLYLAAFLVGALSLVGILIRNKKWIYQTDLERNNWLFMALFIAPLVAVIIFKSVVYDGWRQLYFIYIPFLLISIRGIVITSFWLRQKFATTYITIAKLFLVLTLVFTGWQLIVLHPHQMVYFNALAGGNPSKSFEMDYWGLSYRKGLELVLKKHPTAKSIKVALPGLAHEFYNKNILCKSEAARLLLVPFSEATYFITNHRETLYDVSKSQIKHNLRSDQEVDSVTVNNYKILSIYKLDN